MKGFLFSVVIVCIHTLAHASYSLDYEYDPGDAENITINFFGEAEVSNLFYVIVSEDGVPCTFYNAIVTAATGDLGGAVFYMENGWTPSAIEITTADTQYKHNILGGLWATLSLAAPDGWYFFPVLTPPPGCSYVSLEVYMDPDYETSLATLHIPMIIPEPTTISLLGLGILILRRKKITHKE